MKFAICHPDRKHYAKGLCNACYSRSVRDLAKKILSDREYEERHRDTRNAIRLELYHQRVQSGESTRGAAHTSEPKPQSSE